MKKNLIYRILRRAFCKVIECVYAFYMNILNVFKYLWCSAYKKKGHEYFDKNYLLNTGDFCKNTLHSFLCTQT